jgi:hypothetical protein
VCIDPPCLLAGRDSPGGPLTTVRHGHPLVARSAPSSSERALTGASPSASVSPNTHPAPETPSASCGKEGQQR